MPPLSYYLRRTREQSFRETLNVAEQFLAERVRARVQPAYDRLFNTPPTKDDALRRTGVTSWPALTENLKSRTTPNVWKLTELLVAERADAILNQALNWHTDPQSGYTWDPTVHYRQVPFTPKPGVDIKNPWNISRFHEAVILAQAYRETENDKYALEFVRRVRDWIKQNPFRHGVNWTSAMEAGIRAANWAWAFHLLRGSKAIDAEFVSDLVTSVWCHAHFIKSNLEYREAWIHGKRRRLNSNHYLCDLVGLLFIAIFFPELKLDEERKFAKSELERELFEQTHGDGGDYEHSTAYHRFVWEIFTVAFGLLKCNGEEVNKNVGDQIGRMRQFISMCTHPDGSLTQIGDNDGGMLLPFPPGQIALHRHTDAFGETGVYSMRGADSHVVVSAYNVGMHGFGSHSHNDALSFEYWFGDQAWIVDPGTYVYLSDPEARNWFRSTEAHNTVRVDRAEINPFHKESIFQMVLAGYVYVQQWKPAQKCDELELKHTGYRRLNGPVDHTRLFEFDKASARLEVSDALEGEGVHLLEWFFQLHPAINVERSGTECVLTNGSKRIGIRFIGERISLDIENSWYSPAYGVRQPTHRIVGRIQSELPQTVRIVIEPC